MIIVIECRFLFVHAESMLHIVIYVLMRLAGLIKTQYILAYISNIFTKVNRATEARSDSFI